MNPFKVGDVVYTIHDGKITVTQVNNSSVCYVHFNETRYAYPRECSFTPWPEPNHVRHIEDGLYTVIYPESDYITVARYAGGYWYWATASGGVRPIKRFTNIQIVKRISD